MESVPDHYTPVLIVDDDIGLLLSIATRLTSSGMPEPAMVSDGERALALVREHRFQLVLIDLIMPRIGGLDLLKQIKAELPEVECVIVTAMDEVEMAVRAVKLGTFDYLVKPLDFEKLAIVVDHALERYSLKQGLAPVKTAPSFESLKKPGAFRAMISEDESMARIFHLGETAAATDYNLIITGETGTGKGMLARIIHDLGRRSAGKWVHVNISASSRALFEDDFFGHVKGAYTGAVSQKKGFFEAARRGTLYLDEIAELDPALQAKLLTVIEDKEFYRLGETESRQIDVRIIASTNRDIRKQIEGKRFREDLFYRLNMFHIHIPPLRKRKKDIERLAGHFLNIHAKKNKKAIGSLAPDLVEALMNHPFPGNVRELENIIASAVLLETGARLTLSSVKGIKKRPAPESVEEDSLPPLAEVEKRHILAVLSATRGNRTRAAKILGIGLRTLRRKINTYNTNGDDVPRPK